MQIRSPKPSQGGGIRVAKVLKEKLAGGKKRLNNLEKVTPVRALNAEWKIVVVLYLEKRVSGVRWIRRKGNSQRKEG